MIGAIYYTDLNWDLSLIKICQEQLSKSFSGEIVSVSLKPIDFGRNIVLENVERGFVTMFRQIIIALENSTADYVFFCEHDVLYPESHFDFIPPRDDVFYYNHNVWRWWFGHPTAIRYDGLSSLSGMCANRQLALDNYRIKMKKIEEADPKLLCGREPRLGRTLGYEPGGRRWRKGTRTKTGCSNWRSTYPIVDIRHQGTFSLAKVRLDQFNQQPTGWEEMEITKIPGWNLRGMFNLP